LLYGIIGLVVELVYPADWNSALDE